MGTNGKTGFSFKSLKAKKLPIIMDEDTPERRTVWGYQRPEEGASLPAQVQGRMTDAQERLIQAVARGSNELAIGSMVLHLQSLVPELTDEEAGLIISVTKKHLELLEYLGWGDTPLQQLYAAQGGDPSPNSMIQALRTVVERLEAEEEVQKELMQNNLSETPLTEDIGPALVTSSS